MSQGRKVITTELGRERYCPKCKEYWPLDKDFWHKNQSWCRACLGEYRVEKRKQQQAAKAAEVRATV